ncbi:MAG: activase [Chitinivibrionales bacterium]|nr:activase [Chitinivibrionales bacterium]
MKTLGICFGATTMQAVLVHVDPDIRAAAKTWRRPHEGNPAQTLLSFMQEIDLFDIDRMAVTGRHFRSNITLTSLSEAEAVEAALAHEYRAGNAPELVISLGGETTLVYRIGTHGGIVSVHSGNKCASGTGEFFMQQIGRMDLRIEEAVALAHKGVPHKIAGRCSVFCKSDCTHALNKGEPRENIAAGLCVMMADKITELIKDMDCERVALIGGGALNSALVDILSRRFASLEVPGQAAAFEAYGAALWACANPCRPLPDDLRLLVKKGGSSFDVHPPLGRGRDKVTFADAAHGIAKPGDRCIIGLDVGSTTTKAILLRQDDCVLVASVYLRTNGNPVAASRKCYRRIAEQVGAVPIVIEGLGITGSGRQIAALHALTDNVINEIIAHATAAAFFDPEVDTIFEIGGQDAKYTCLTGGVPSDYAMNEACSAGTGSFLEESARESLNVATEAIGELALAGNAPPNFTDQCAAFISSDIKRAGQEGIARNDILAGLVYSICLNYVNRVKGARPVGAKIFMQGGVCYNEAVPVAMASLLNAPIVVPPDPGLMGAFGVALEVKKRIELGLSERREFHLDELANRKAQKEGVFICAGGREKCDRKCEISRIRVSDSTYPFGGICDKYYNQRLNKTIDVASYDLVEVRQKLLFEQFGHCDPPTNEANGLVRRTIGISRSFLTNSLFPLYSGFFKEIGLAVIAGDAIDPDGINRIEAAFCLPAELAHGSFVNLLKKNLDYIFLPQVMQLPVPNVPTWSKCCVFVQGEPYYLKTTFRKEIESSTTTVLSPVLNMYRGYEEGRKPLVRMAQDLGVSERRANEAFTYACARQIECDKEIRRIGKDALGRLEADPDAFGIVLFGRPYNAFARDANMGIPHKVASRGYTVIPHDMLPADGYNVDKKMFWAMGQKIMKAAQYVKLRKNLFGFYISNFSCGPDSFLLGYFRNLMDQKPSLTLELDQHTADAGIDTRIEAALDIIKAYRRMRTGETRFFEGVYRQARIAGEKKPAIVTSDGRTLPLNHPDVEVVIPSMGSLGARLVAAVFRSMGIAARALPVPEKQTLQLARKNTTCKECLPYLLTTGSFLQYLQQQRPHRRVTLCFLPTGGGPCRLGQYGRSLEQQIAKLKLPNVAVFTVTDENGYGGLGSKAIIKAWQSILISDVLGDIRSLISVAARDAAGAEAILQSCTREVERFFEGSLSVRLSTVLSNVAERLSQIELAKDPATLPVVSLVGEIFVRREEFSRRNIVEYLQQHGFVVRVAPVAEYICYSNYVVGKGLGERRFSLKDHVRMHLTARIQDWWERRIKTILASSGLYRFEMIEVDKTIQGVQHLVNENFRGECVLTVGLSLREILHDSCGVISIGPFGCMPSRVAESILKKEMTVSGKARMPGWNDKVERFKDVETFPFLAIETDGSPFPQLIEANLEAFVLQARRVHQRLLAQKGVSSQSARPIDGVAQPHTD